MEEKVYHVQWKRDGKAFLMWVAGRPDWQVKKATLKDAEYRLALLIIKRGGAQHPVFEINPPLPLSKDDDLFGEPELYEVGGGNNPVELVDAPRGQSTIIQEATWARQYLTDPICSKCGVAHGQRNQTPLAIDVYGGTDDGAFGSIGKHSWYDIHLFSEDFLRLLRPSERKYLEFREVVPPPRTRRRYYELLGPRALPLVGIRGRPISHLKLCDACKHTQFGYSMAESIYKFIAAVELPRTRSMFTIAAGQGIGLCMTGPRWREICGQKGARGLTTKRIGVVPDSLVLRKMPRNAQVVMPTGW